MKKIIFGAGKMGKRYIDDYGKDDIIYFVDNFSQEKMIDGVPIISFEELKKFNMEDCKVIICTKYYEEIMKQLDQEGMRYEIGPYFPSISAEIAHGNWLEYLTEHFDKKGMEILEIGSCDRSGNDEKGHFKYANHTGLDIVPGKNVDVVGDAHYLSTYFEKGRKFDLIFSSAVFEHLAMPWVVAQEISKMLKIGGVVFVETHFSFEHHGAPYMFFQFSENALKILFNRQLGFETIAAGVCNPLEGKFSDKACEYLRGRAVNNLFCHSEYLGRKVEEYKDFQWDKIDYKKIL